MATDIPWDSRWRQAPPQDRHLDNRQYPPTPSGSENLQTPTTATQAYATSWRGEERIIEEHHHRQQQSQQQQLPSISRPYMDSSNRLADPESEQRHRLTATSPFEQRLTSSWYSLPASPHAHQKYDSTPGPLTLQIPETQELSRTSTTEKQQSYLDTPLSRQQTGTSLPSFASFQERTNRADEPDEVEIAPMSARLTCPQCTTLQPLIRDLTFALTELDELVQASCNNGSTRTSDIPSDNTVRAVTWMLERITKTKSDLQYGLRQGLHYPQDSALYRAPAPQDDLTSHPLKRSAWSQEDLPPAKRQQCAAYSNGSAQAYTNPVSQDGRRSSIDYAVDSPLPAESVPESGYPRNISPGVSARSTKALPSPSSLAYPLSGAPSVLPQAPHSLGSPATSYQHAGSIHTTSTNSATSAHLADLQHQVTLKSLALQTLQSEYSSLLQKLQRERVKSQTIEKKTTVADQEVNDLTSRNEELVELVKGLESQLECSERKRETECADAARDKDQWGRMLELGGRIQSKHAEEKQQLKDEIDNLKQRLMAHDSKTGYALDGIKQDGRVNVGTTPASSEVGVRALTPVQTVATQYSLTTNSSSVDEAGLKRQVEVLTARIEVLRFALEEARRHNQILDEQALGVIKRCGQLGSVVQRALQDDNSTTLDRPARPLPDAHPLLPGPGATHALPQAEDAFGAPRGQDSRKLSQSTASSSATLASIARAVSPGPAELGFHVTPSTSSPEEIIQALGPVPAPLPAFQLSTPFETPVSVKNKKSQGAPKRAAKQTRRQSVDGVNTWMLPPMSEPPRQPQQQAPPKQQQQQHLHHQQQPEPNIALQLGSFRPLSNQAPAPTPQQRTPPFRQGTSPPSHHSSPGPQRDGASPHGSAGSAEADVNGYMPASSQSRMHLPPMYAQQRNGFDGSRAGDMGAVMPPPPRPGVVGAAGVGRD